ncbi:Ubiquitin-like superfamily protein isoform 1 [Hibiscus syriacus]|uniref:Ubiquitin-like superfamily protein isoform 1 n=1 Tax=Hibiscus syriacus TaxID=106335 RepID=A0A6A3C8F5_HIBSY|nr:Ubiquitin-like superfamily protein isoform 1 [Hibiscus syriacus]
MSITPCFLVFLLCLSLHASTARRLAAVHSANQRIKELHVSAAKNDTQKLQDAEVKFKTVENEKEKSSSGEIGASKPVVSVSWRVPHRKHGEKLPGFNQDYSPPKTHPPSHN